MPLGRSMDNQKQKIVVGSSCNVVPLKNAKIPCGFCPALFNTFFAKTNHWAKEHSEKKNGGNYFNAPNQTGVKRGEKLSKILVKNLVKLPNTNSKDGEQVLNIRELSTTQLQKDYAGMKSKITLPPIRSDKIIAPKVSSNMIKNSEDWESFIQDNYKSKSSQIQTEKAKDSNQAGIKSIIVNTPIIGSDKIVAPELSSTLVKNLVKLPNTNSKDREQVLNIRELSTTHLQKDYAGMKSKITLPSIRSDKIIAPKVSSNTIKNSEDCESFIQENYKSKSSQIQTERAKDSNHAGIKQEVAVTPIISTDKIVAGMKSKITLPPIRSDKIIAPKVSSNMIKNSEDWESFIQENYKTKSSQIQTEKAKDSNHAGIKSKIAVTPIIGSDKIVAPKLSSTLVKNPFYNPPKPKSAKALMQKKIDSGIKKQLEGLQTKEGHAHESKNKGQ